MIRIENECITINPTTEQITVFSSSKSSGPGQAGESSPPLPYLGRRAGSVRNAIILITHDNFTIINSAVKT